MGAALDGLAGCWVAVTADDDEGARLGERLADDLDAVPFRLADELRPLYHAAAVFASNALVTVSAIAESLFDGGGGPRSGEPRWPRCSVRRSHTSRTWVPPARSRARRCAGDAGTIRRNLEALRRHAPELVPTYVALARSALDLAERSGRVPPASRAAVEDVLAEWS